MHKPLNKPVRVLARGEAIGLGELGDPVIVLLAAASIPRG